MCLSEFKWARRQLKRGSWASCAPLNHGRWSRRMVTIMMMHQADRLAVRGWEWCEVIVKMPILINYWPNPAVTLYFPLAPLAEWRLLSFNISARGQVWWPPAPLYACRNKWEWPTLEVSWNVMTPIKTLSVLSTLCCPAELLSSGSVTPMAETNFYSHTNATWQPFYLSSLV